MDHPTPARAASGQRLLEAMDRAGLGVRACYWRLLRPTRRCWALAVSLREFGPAFEPGLSRLMEVVADLGDELAGLHPLDLWALPRRDPEPLEYARAVARREDAHWPLRFEGDGRLPPALIYRLPPP